MLYDTSNIQMHYIKNLRGEAKSEISQSTFINER